MIQAILEQYALINLITEEHTAHRKAELIIVFPSSPNLQLPGTLRSKSVEVPVRVPKINRRMKKRGMRWKRANGTAIVTLRTDLLNNDWVIPQRLRAFP